MSLFKVSKGAGALAKVDHPSVAPNAMKYGRVGSRKGMSSVLDTETVNKNIEKHANQLAGAYKMQFLKGDGTVLTNATYNNGERLFRSRADGSFTMIDREAMEYKKKIQEEVNDYVNEVIGYCIYEDDLASEALGIFNTAEYRRVLQARGDPSTPDATCPASLVPFGATASELDSVSSTSKEYSGGIAKLRWYIKNVALPVMDSSTGTESLVEKNDQK
jgi:hypothetical protein